MTLSPWLVYFWGSADQFRESIYILIGVCAATTVVCGIASTYPWEDEGKAKKSLLATVKRFLMGIVALTLLAAFVPSSKTIALMVVVPSIINSQSIQKDLPEIYQMAKDALKETLKVK